MNKKERQEAMVVKMERRVEEALAKSFESWWEAFSRLGVEDTKIIAGVAFEGGWKASAALLGEILKEDEEE